MRTGKGILAGKAAGVAVILAATAAVSACGSSGNSGGSASARRNAGIAFADCMRSHGVPNFPDPGSGGGIQIPSGTNPQAPAFQSAQRACQKLLPGGGPPPHASEQQKLRLFAMSRCMRAHGVTGFPDPVSTPPSGPPAGGGIAFGAPGSVLVIPQSLIESPAFSHAAGVCGLPGAGPGRAKSAPAP